MMSAEAVALQAPATTSLLACASRRAAIQNASADPAKLIQESHAPQRLSGAPCRWEGNPSTNVQIINNTVMDAPYQSGLTSPGITVYAGGANLNATSAVQSNITISGNLVIGGMVCTRPPPGLVKVWILWG